MIDLRSDTVTRPTPAMYAAMASAPLGDDVLGDEPTVRKLEDSVAELLGFPSAMYVPSGTMSNQIALMVHTRPGDAALFEEEAHMVYYEAGAPGALAGVVTLSYPSQGGIPDPAVVAGKLWQRTHHTPGVRFVAVENTHNRHGGAVIPPDILQAHADQVRAAGAVCHLDGARVWNAAVALDLHPAALTQMFDSVSVCFSKGLGAPVGSALLGSADFIDEARYVRKRLGGGMRQSGLLAAAALVALDDRDQLKEDHRRARKLAEALIGTPGLSPLTPTTNIVLVDTVTPANDWMDALAQVGVGCVPFGSHRLRFVTHRDVDDAGLEIALGRIKEIAGQLAQRPE